MNQQPSIRIARWAGLRKGTLMSRYFQVYLGFFISGLLHAWSTFNATREGGGEMWFFMMQAVAITGEDCVQWAWRCYTKTPASNEPRGIVRLLGLAWTLWLFSYTLPVWPKSLMRAAFLEGDYPSIAMALGKAHADKLFWA